jgi:mannose-6-phosphate isomerase-like protein (cupin superfamily)
VVREDGSVKAGPGTAIFIPPDETHQFKNTGEQLLRFICVIPSSAG